MSKTNGIDPNVPAGSEDPKLGDNRIRNLAAGAIEILAVNHYVGSDGGSGTGYDEDAAGEHTVVTLRVQSTPTAEANKGKLYTKDVNSKAELHFQDEDSNEIQITTAGAIKKSNIEDSAFVPSGVILPYGGSSAPTGWLLCNGSAVSRTTYSALFAIISTSYGSGDGSTTFNVPDMRGRVPVGLDLANANLNAADTLGETGGEENHTLTESELAAHTHGVGTSILVSGGPSAIATAGPSDTYKSTSTGGDGAHNNLQPYNTVNYIIKT